MNIKVDVVGKVCPTPVVETIKALRKAEKGDVIEVIGTEKSSKSEIQLLAKEFDVEILSVDQKGDIWCIKIKKTKEIK
jgi:TusA-related sulfurtransferase